MGRGSLLSEERKDMLKRFSAPHFKKVAVVLVGEPKKDYKERVMALMLKDKQAASDMEFKAKKLDEQRKKLIEKRQKEHAKAAKKAEKEKKKAEDEAKKKAEEAEKAAEG